MENIYVYGPPGAGKSTVGRRLAECLEIPFVDLDDVIVARDGRAIPQIFAEEGEAGFRERELAALQELAAQQGQAAQREQAAQQGQAAQHGQAAQQGQAAQHGQAGQQEQAVQQGQAAQQGQAVQQEQAAQQGQAVQQGQAAQREQAAKQGQAAQREQAAKQGQAAQQELAGLGSITGKAAAGRAGLVVALGGGALLADAARQAAETSGVVVCLQAQPETLLARLQADGDTRPLLRGDAAGRLRELLQARAAHYQSFPRQVDTSQLDVEAACWQVQVQTGRFHVRGMGQTYDIVARPGALHDLGALLAARGLKGPLVVVADDNVAPLYAGQALDALRSAGYAASVLVIPAGEAAKTIETIQALWAAFVEARLERSSTVVALGGGVVGDMTGFAAATFLRGINWVNVPTTLLSMVDSSLGGKTGIDLPQGKNLVGAFYPPRLVLADPRLLNSLPDSELRSGLAETIKHGVIADPDLLERCGQDWAALTADLDAVARQGMAVKVRVIEIDPYEKGLRQALNLGHTVGHGVELASDFRLSHGESVAIGMVVEARLAEACGVAKAGLAEEIAVRLQEVGLPVSIPPELDRERILAAMQMDKKRAAGKQRFALPERIGSVRVGVEIEDWQRKIFA